MDINEVALRIFCAWQSDYETMEKLLNEDREALAYNEAERFMKEGRKRGYIPVKKEEKKPKKRYRIKTKEEFEADEKPLSEYYFLYEILGNEVTDYMVNLYADGDNMFYYHGIEVYPDMITEIKDGE